MQSALASRGTRAAVVAGRSRKDAPRARQQQLRRIVAVNANEVKTTEPEATASTSADAAPPAPPAAASPAAAIPEGKEAQPEKTRAKSPIPEGKAEIYIGFAKGDYAPRAGRTGRVVVDDPSKYPGRDNDFVGGWAGGEVGLKAFASSSTSEEASTSGRKDGDSTSKRSSPKKRGVYIGHEKEDYEGRRLGLPGRFVDDDPQKYPDKESVGPLVNAVGGFAGGERGVKAFAETGEIPLAPDGKGSRQFSPLAFAGFVALVGAGGGLLLNSVEETVVEGGDSPLAREVASELALVATESPQRAALTAAVAVFAVLAGAFAVKGAVDGAKARAAALGATIADGAKAAAFWVAVFFAFKLVIENS